jgi:ubiquinone/menaquinone biosynthesis C-methylase UbiE
MQDLIEFAARANQVEKDVFLPIYEHFLKETRSSIYALRYLIIKGIDSSLSRKVIKEGDSVLNVGCGFPINEVMFRSWAAGRIVGIDVDKSIIEKGKVWLNNLNINDVELHVGDALNLEYPDKSFDVVVSFSAIEHVRGWENWGKWIAEMSRVAKRNVVLITSNRKNRILCFLSRFHSGFEHFFTREEIERLFGQHDMNVVLFDANTLWYSSYLPLIPAKLKLNKCTLRFDLLVEKLTRISALKGHGGRMGFIAEKPAVQKPQIAEEGLFGRLRCLLE